MLAAVQARLVKVLLWGSAVFGLAGGELERGQEQRGAALAAALGEILLDCSGESGRLVVATAGMRKHFSSAGRLRGDGVTETLTTITTTDPAALYQLLTSQVKMVNTKILIHIHIHYQAKKRRN